MAARPPIAREAFDQLAERFSEQASSKLENAFLERPALRALIPDVRGKAVLDAGCGPGHNSEWLAERGARLTAIDVSPAMAGLARRRLGESARVRVADLEKPLDFLGDGEVDLVVAALVLDSIEDPARLFRELNRVLRGGGHLVASYSHPLADFRYSESRDYFEQELLRVTWRGFGRPHVDVPFYRRPLSATLGPLLESGFALERLVEPKPLVEGRDADPETWQKLQRLPGFLCFRACKTGGAPCDES